MVIVLNRNISEREKEDVRAFLDAKGFTVREIVGEEETILGAVGIISVDVREVEALPGVNRVIPITKPYKLASREFKKDDTVVSIGRIHVGNPRLTVIAGPCAVESREQILLTARRVRESGAVILRGGAYKPRTSPYAFQGLGEEGLAYLKEAGEKEGMPVVSEIVATEMAEMMCDYVDIFQIGARNMQNFELLKKVGSLGKPVILKRGLAATIEEWLMAAEYLIAHGTDNVILCERGIRTFETATRNTLDISSIPVVKKLSHLPIIVDPSHATGMREKVPPMALAAVAAGADGIMVEVHPDPEHASSDGPQSLYFEQFEKIMHDIEAISSVVGKALEKLPLRSAKRGEAITLSGEMPAVSTVAFQGEKGAFSEKALYQYFRDGEVVGLPCEHFQDVFDAVQTQRAEYGIIPIENSLTGSIHENYDLLLTYPDIKIIGEKQIRIVHNLIAMPGTSIHEIRRIYSHPQGLQQCARFLETLTGVEKVPYYDTAGSVAFIAREGKREWAAIAGEEAAEAYGMEILKSGIETNAGNYTRFFIVTRREQPDPERPNKASIVFRTPDKPGALFRCMKALAERGLNIKKLESRPILGNPWQYMFYVDVELPQRIEEFHAALSDIEREGEDVRILGMYRI
jgi:3-deoxy-7-phosphoheptulonate synthase